jgi:hypothetical protein
LVFNGNVVEDLDAISVSGECNIDACRIINVGRKGVFAEYVDTPIGQIRIQNNFIEGHKNFTTLAADTGVINLVSVNDTILVGNEINCGSGLTAYNEPNKRAVNLHCYSCGSIRSDNNIYENGDTLISLREFTRDCSFSSSDRMELSSGELIRISKSSDNHFQGCALKSGGLKTGGSDPWVLLDGDSYGNRFKGCKVGFLFNGESGTVTERRPAYVFHDQRWTLSAEKRNSFVDIEYLHGPLHGQNLWTTADVYIQFGATATVDRAMQDYGNAVPTFGTWPRGWIRYNTEPAAVDTVAFWVCVEGGTVWADGATTGSITSGSNELTVANTAKVEPGMIIDIAGVTGAKRALSYGNPVILDSVADATVTDAAVTPHNPVWIAK